MKIDHVGIAVKNIDETLAIYMKMGELDVERTVVDSQKVKIALFDAGGTHLELLEPTGEDSNMAKFIKERGEGLHHIAFAVDDIDESMARLTAKGFQFIYDKPANGKFGSRVNFIHPKGTGRVLIELTQNKKKE
jgi:methylmalonyl-CoA/ethylmalonyl-CoA epimerase